MPKIETFQQNDIKPIVEDRGTANAFIQKADLSVANAAQNLINVTHQIAKTKIEDYNDSKAEQAMSNFVRDKNEAFFNPQNGYFNTRGENAHTGKEGITKSLEEIRNKYSKDLSPEARDKYMRGSQIHLDNSQVSINQHASKGLDDFDSQTRQATIDNTFETGTLYWNDLDEVEQQNAIGQQALIRQAERDGVTGVALTEKLQSYNSIFYSGVIKATADNDLEKAKGLVEKWDSKFESHEDKKKVQDYIASKQLKQDNKNEAADTYTLASEIRGTSGKDLRFGMQLIDKIPKEKRAKVRREYFSQVAAYNKIEAVENKNTVDDALKYMRQNGSIDQWVATGDNFEKYNKLTAQQQASLGKEGRIVTPDLLDVQLTAAMKEGDKEQVQEMIDQYGDHFSVKDAKDAQIFLQTDDKFKRMSLNSPMVRSVTDNMGRDSKNKFNDALVRWNNQHYEEFKKNPTDAEIRNQVKYMATKKDINDYLPDPKVYQTDTFIEDSMMMNSMSKMDKHFPLDDNEIEGERERLILNFKQGVGRYPGNTDFKQYKEVLDLLAEENKGIPGISPEDQLFDFVDIKGRLPTKKELQAEVY